MLGSYNKAIRISAHSLPVETGCHNVARGDRICKHCNMNKIGIEQHFLTSRTFIENIKSI